MSKHLETLISLEPGETIELEVRRHLFVFWNQIAVVSIFFVLPLIASPFLVVLLNRFIAIPLLNSSLLFIYLYLLWVLMLWILVFWRWTDYYLDVWILTNHRVFDIEQRGIFNRNISVFRLENLQDITVEVNGILATFLKYGDIHIHTAGENPNIVIKTAGNPLLVKEKILEAQKRALDEHRTSIHTNSAPDVVPTHA
jgi:hypothetical protein